MQISHAGKFAFGKAALISPDVADIPEMVTAFTDAAVRAKKAGFDGVQIHCAHGYLLSQFLTPAFNKRQDQYGGSIENRTRIHVEIIRAVREAVGPDYPIIIKLNSQDFMENGLTLEDSLEAARIMTEAGIDAIELSGGLLAGKITPSRTGIKVEADEAYLQTDARAFKEVVDIPLILVGGMRSFATAERMVESGTADYISMSRPLIREPELINRWKSGDMRRAFCLSDNQCFRTTVSGNGVSCPVAAMKEE
jgi:2,4-dienoyl-CoA reductase-like NADH-dependent reductase (Old Yellow Enzyme family)